MVDFRTIDSPNGLSTIISTVESMRSLCPLVALVPYFYSSDPTFARIPYTVPVQSPSKKQRMGRNIDISKKCQGEEEEEERF